MAWQRLWGVREFVRLSRAELFWARVLVVLAAFLSGLVSLWSAQPSGPWLETQGDAVVAVPQPRRSRPIPEAVTLMSSASFAVVFRSGDQQTQIHTCSDRSWKAVPETGPACTAFVLGLGAEQWQVAARAVIAPGPVFFNQRTAERTLGALLPEHGKCAWAETTFPLGFGEIPL